MSEIDGSLAGMWRLPRAEIRDRYTLVADLIFVSGVRPHTRCGAAHCLGESCSKATSALAFELR
jgi:hypothetical protein